VCVAALELLALIAAQAGDDRLGLGFGRSLAPGQLGVLDHLMLTAETVEDVLSRFVDYREVMLFPFDVSLETRGERVILSGRIPASLHIPSEHFVDMLAAALIQRLRLALGAEWLPHAVELPREHPSDLAPYVALFGSRITFQTTRFSIVLWRRDLHARMPAVWQHLDATVLIAARHILAENLGRSDLVGRVRQMITDHLAGERDLNLDAVARGLGMSARALQWQLLRHERTFESLVLEIRRDTACKLLADKQVSIKVISRKLGFSDASAFSHWAKRQLGATPRAYRQALAMQN
jgi:AraC-like DNA-binding protein